MELAFDRLGLDVVAVEHRAGNEEPRRAIEEYVDEFGGTYEGMVRNRAVKAGEARDRHPSTVRREEYGEATG